MIEKPLVSIVIPSFNKAELLIEMIKSIFLQTYERWELIIVDDGSDENNFQKVHNYVNCDKRCLLVRRNREPKNGNTCRNIGIEMAKGKYLIIFDSDDIISSTCLENRVKFMESHPECDYASFPAACFYDGKPLPLWDKAIMTFGKQKGRRDILYYLLSYNYPFTVWTNIYRYTSVKNITWDEQIFVMQDFDWMVSCELKGLKHKYSNSKQYDYYYRQFSDGHNVCGSYIGKQKCQSTYYLFDKTLSRLKDEPDYEARKKQYFYYVTVHLNRLLNGGEYNEVDRFLCLCEKYYSKKYCLCLNRLTRKYENKIKQEDVTPLYLFYLCLFIYKMPQYTIPFIKNLIKRILGQEQVMY